MNKTRVDDMLIEMIEPKLKEINEKFSSGKSLTQDDINFFQKTLLFSFHLRP